MSLDSLGSELAGVADIVTNVATTLNIIAQNHGQIDGEVAARLADALRRADKPMRDLADELSALSLALTEPTSGVEH